MKTTVDTNRSVHLSASAGSGKTRALKDRYLALLDVLEHRGLNIDQAVAITFTDKAAAEIKERVMHDLPESMLKQIIRGRQDLRISTIHSFCMNLLKRYPLEAGLPPDFGVLDARDQAYKVQKAIEDTLEEADRDAGLMAPLNDFTADELIATIEFLLSIRSKLKRMEIDAGGPKNLVQAIRSSMSIDGAEREMTSFVASAEWSSLFTQMELFLRSQKDFYEECDGSGHAALANAKDILSARRIAGSLMPLYFTKTGEPRKKPSISKTNFNANTTYHYPEYQAAFANAQESLSRFLSAYHRAQAGYEAISFLHLFQRAEGKYQEAKLREGLLDFDDLEIYAYRLLQGQESPDILYWLDRKILHFLVDEFQDTSDIQWAVLGKLTEEIFSGQGADKPMRPTLFVVGDEKQSIYRFREANYRLIHAIRDKMEKNIPPESRDIRTLDTNFRSTPEVIQTVNAVFRSLWGESYIPSNVERKEHTGSVRLIEIMPGKADGSSMNDEHHATLPYSPPIKGGATSSTLSPRGRGLGEGGSTDSLTEADILAREIKSFIDNKTTIYEKKDVWQDRAAGYEDCAILIQSRTRLKDYEAALQKAGIPFRVVGGIGFYEEDEIQALINVLFFLWNHEDKLALAATLKSSLFGLTDKSIYDLFQYDGNILDALKIDHPGDWELLHRWINMAGLVQLSWLIHTIVNDTGAYVRFGKKNPQAIFNIDKLIDTAREFDRRGYTTLQDFVEWVKNIREADQREATADMNLPGFQGAVSIMTVHKAKGLEYPIVFLPGMNQAQRSVSHGPDVIMGETDHRVRMAVKDAANPLYDEMWEQEKEELRREHQRLLYVAMTRARDHLVMIGTPKDEKRPVKQNTWLDYLHQASPKPLFDAEMRSVSGSRIFAYPAIAVPGEDTKTIPTEGAAAPSDRVSLPTGPDLQAIINNLTPIPPSRSMEWKRATDFISQDKESMLELISLQAAASSVSPLTRGSVLHRCLEEQAKNGSYDMDRIMAEYPDILALGNELVQKFSNNAISVLNAVLSNNDIAWVFERHANAYAELPFIYKRGNSLVSGIIDRIVIKHTTGHVIDYKAILIENDESRKAWTDHYRPQLQVYCEAVKDVFKLSSVEGSLLFLDSNLLELVVII